MLAQILRSRLAKPRTRVADRLEALGARFELNLTKRAAAGLPDSDTDADPARQLHGNRQRIERRARGPRRGSRAKAAAARTACTALLLLCLPLAAQAQSDAVHSDAVQRAANILQQIKARYVRPIDDQKLVADAIDGVLKGLDPYSTYLDAEAYRQQLLENRGEYGGVGIEAEMRDGAIEVVSVFEDTPASRAGLRAGDRILKVDDTSLDGLTMEQAVTRVRGDPGTQVTLSVLRKDAEPSTLILTRDAIVSRSVEWSLIEPGLAYVRVTRFQAHTGEMVADAIEHLFQADGDRIASIILDLRDNPGGLVRAAVGVSSIFLGAGAPIVSSEGADKSSQMHLSARSDDYVRSGETDYVQGLPAAVKSLPMVVLVNSGSASAAEIVAGALQDNQRATILGTRTFGKGTIQTVIPLGNGTGMRLTTAYYRTPSGHLIQGSGVAPDIVVAPQPFEPQRVARTQTESLPYRVVTERQTSQMAAAPTYAPCAMADDPVLRIPDADADDFRIERTSGDCQLERALRLLRRAKSISHN